MKKAVIIGVLILVVAVVGYMMLKSIVTYAALIFVAAAVLYGGYLWARRKMRGRTSY